MMIRGYGRLAFLLATSALTIAPAVPALAQTPASREAVRRFDVPAGPASAALNAFASQAGLELLYPYDAVEGLKSPGLHGNHTSRTALQLLLQTLPLVVAADDGRVLTLRSSAAPTGSQPPGPSAIVEDVVVTGSRYQTREEIANRRDSLTIVDTLTQDDTGDLADQSLAEALRRIPGVSTVYDEDEGSLITIRGVQSDLNHVTIDGLSIMPVGTGGGGRRQVDLALVPSQSSRTTEVYKTFTADLEAAAVGGVLNIVPRSAYDRQRPQVLLDIYGNYFTYDDVPGENSMDGAKTSPYGGGFNATFASQFGPDNQFGVVLTAGFQQKQRDQSKPATPDRLFFNDAGAAVPYGDPTWNGNVGPDVFVDHSLTNRLRNAGGSLRLEYKPNDRFYNSLLLFAYTQDESETRNTNNLATLDQPRNITATTGDFRVREVRVATRFHTYDRATRGAQFHSNYRPDDNSLVEFGAGYSFASYKDEMPDVAYSYAPNTRLYYDVSDFTPTFTLETPDLLSDPARYTLKNASITNEDIEGELTELRLDYSRNVEPGDLGWGFKAGLNWRTFRLRRDNEITNYVSDRSSLADVAFDPHFTPLSWIYPVTWMDGPKFWDEVAPTLAINATSSANASHANDMQYREDIAAGYLQTSFATDRLLVIGGLRYDQSDMTAWIPHTLAGVLQPGFVSTKAGYDHLLPSLNVGYEISDAWKVKASFSRTIGRPNPRDLATAEKRDDGNLTITRGNPDIRPRQADNYDLALEHYFNGRNGLVTLGVFDKEVVDDIFTQRTQMVIDGQNYSVTQPMNAQASSMRGVEFNYINNSLPLPGPLADKLGVAFNATRLWGEMAIPVSSGIRSVDRQVNQMDWAGNLAVYYALPRGGEVRLAGNYQDGYVSGFGDDPSLDQGWKPFLTWDLTMRHRLTDRLIVKAQARNLTNENRTELFGEDLQYRLSELEFGRSFYLDLIFKL